MLWCRYCPPSPFQIGTIRSSAPFLSIMMLHLHTVELVQIRYHKCAGPKMCECLVGREQGKRFKELPFILERDAVPLDVFIKSFTNTGYPKKSLNNCKTYLFV